MSQITLDQMLAKFAAHVLARLFQQHDYTCGNLASAIELPYESAQKLLDQAVKQGWVRESQPDPMGEKYYNLSKKFAEILVGDHLPHE